MIGNILGNLDGTILVINVGTDLGPLYGSFGGCNDSKLGGLLLVDSLGSTDSNILGFDEGIILGLFDCKVFGTILGNVDGIILRIIVGTYTGSSYR